MRQKKPALVITFDTTAEAMAMESFCEKYEIPGRLIPLPGEISAGCGLAWKTTPDEEARIEKAWKTIISDGLPCIRWSYEIKACSLLKHRGPGGLFQ